MDVAELPYVDEHATVVAAPAGRVWSALVENVDRSFSRSGAARYAHAVGCEEHVAAGPRPLSEGSTIPGFRVAAAVPPTELVLTGRHRYSSYALSFHIEAEAAGRTRLRAETRAAFPGMGGALYRLLVIGTGGHAFAVRRMLSGIAERSLGHGS